MSEKQREILQPISWLIGTWKGSGKATYPSHDDAYYEDSMSFRLIENAFVNEPIIHFEEIAWVIDNGEKEFKHWETGYFKPTDKNSIQFFICHNTGRIEVTYGRFIFLDRAAQTFGITFLSESIRNDEGTKVALKSRREIIFQNDRVSYRLEMATKDVQEMTPHLNAELHRG